MDPIFEVSQQRLATRREKAENELNERYVPAIRGRWTYCIVKKIIKLVGTKLGDFDQISNLAN